MSWLSTPVRIIPALNTINAAILERKRYSRYPGSTGGEVVYSLPYSAHQGLKYAMNEIRAEIQSLYRNHFPLGNFGKWALMRPYADFTNAQIDDAIAAELRKADIDPAGYFWEAPHPLGDGTFVRACYHLLNNVLLYTFPSAVSLTANSRFMGWENNVYDGPRGLAVPSLVGKIEKASYYYEHCDIHYVIPEDEYPRLQGEWAVKHTTGSVQRYVYNAKSYDQLEYSYTPTDEEPFEVHFSGNQSENFSPWSEEIYKNIEYYRALAENEYYYYVVVTQHCGFSEVRITEENFTPPDYKYFD